MRRAARIDATQQKIVSALRAAGASVQITSAVGQGCPDLAVGFRTDNYWLECKDGKQPPSGQKLTPAQLKWHREWLGSVAVVKTPQEALKAIGL